jgi:hypothetical protein
MCGATSQHQRQNHDGGGKRSGQIGHVGDSLSINSGKTPGSLWILVRQYGGSQGHDEKVLTKCSCYVLFWSHNDSTLGETPMTISRLHELFALAVMFTAGYACMVVG